MKEKMTLPGLVANLAIRSGKTKKQCEDFLRELFDTIEETLVEGESLKIKNFGTFKLIRVEARKSVDVNTGEDIEIPGHNKVTFMPAKELAELINAPFSMFESVEIPYESNDLEEGEQLQIEADERTAEAEEEEIETAALENSDSSEDTSEEIQKYTTENQEHTTAEQESTPEDQESVLEEQESAHENQEYAVEENEYKPKKFRFLWGFLTGVASCVIIIGVVSFFLFKDNLKDLGICFNHQDAPTTEVVKQSESVATTEKAITTPLPADTTMKSDSDAKMVQSNTVEATVPTAASDQLVYDTISKTRYLTTMAKAHYGNYNLWPYIYFENQKILGHPDRIKPGTRVVIPSLTKYNVNPESKEDIEIAKKKGLEIYKRYQ